MPESLEQRDSAVVSSAGEPGPLSRLLQELADAPGPDLFDAWKAGLQPGDRLDRFEIRKEVGRGGFGAVYEAFDGELGRRVAIKTLRPGRTRQELSAGWIKKEAEAVAKLGHPCIVTLFDVCNCETQGPRAADCTAMAHHALGRPKESQQALEALLARPEGDTTYSIARVYAFRGQADPAFEWLERARSGHVRRMNTLLSDPFLRPLHSDPRWAELLRKMNLPVD